MATAQQKARLWFHENKSFIIVQRRFRLEYRNCRSPRKNSIRRWCEPMDWQSCSCEEAMDWKPTDYVEEMEWEEVPLPPQVSAPLPLKSEQENVPKPKDGSDRRVKKALRRL
ncbi:hypothetical protein AVEN_274370-1 [Araneus ventricosus]|uniref:DUF4817 domain-containing protein n=1 Tax=Araneus ventricosus TaxID=182803 RepID=A0A4Y2ML20_ARAVE|nr:hypothetical protein AVEN_274370-1 [Araneus ventricosus]